MATISVQPTSLNPPFPVTSNKTMNASVKENVSTFGNPLQQNLSDIKFEIQAVSVQIDTAQSKSLLACAFAASNYINLLTILSNTCSSAGLQQLITFPINNYSI